MRIRTREYLAIDVSFVALLALRFLFFMFFHSCARSRFSCHATSATDAVTDVYTKCKHRSSIADTRARNALNFEISSYI